MVPPEGTLQRQIKLSTGHLEKMKNLAEVDDSVV
jgi:hypothetical protein